MSKVDNAPCVRFFWTSALCLLLLLFLPSLTTPAHAVEGEITLGLGPGTANLPLRGSEGQSGFGGGAYAEYRFNHFLGLTLGGHYGYQLSESEEMLAGQHIASFWAGMIYNIDVATYVPFLTLAATSYIARPQLVDGEGNAVDLGLKAGIGVDYRRWRHWSFGLEANLHAFLTDLETYPVYLTTMLRLNYHFELF